MEKGELYTKEQKMTSGGSQTQGGIAKENRENKKKKKKKKTY